MWGGHFNRTAPYWWVVVVASCWIACGDLDGPAGDREQSSVLGHAETPLTVSIKEQEKGRPYRLRSAKLFGEDTVPYASSPDPRIMFVSTFESNDESSKDVERQPEMPAEGDEETADNLDPSGIFEVRETGFLPAPDLRVERANGHTVTLRWTSISGSDGYRLTVVRFGSDGHAIDNFQQDIRGTHARVNTGGFSILASVRAYGWEPMRRSDPSNKITFDPSDP